MKKIYLIIIILLLTIPIVNADVLTNVLVSISHDDVDIVGGEPTDTSGQGVILNRSGTTSGAVGLVGEAYIFVPDDEIEATALSADATTVSICLYFDNTVIGDDTVNKYGIITDQTVFGGLVVGSISGSINDETIGWLSIEDGTQGTDYWKDIISAGWHHFFFRFNTTSSEWVFHLDGTKRVRFERDGGTDNDFKSALWEYGERGFYNDLNFEGRFDQLTMWSDEKDLDDMRTMYNSGNCFNPFAGPSTPAGNESFEQTVSIDQIVNLTINSNTFQNVITGNVEVSNQSNISLGYTVNIKGQGAGTTAECRVLFDGTDHNTLTSITVPDADTRSMYLNSDLFFKPSGNYTVELECRKIGAIQFNVGGSKGIISIHTDNKGRPINTKGFNANITITSSAFQKLGEFNFTLTNRSDAGGLERVFYLDSSIKYNFDSTGTIELYALINGNRTGDYPRYGSIGSIGSGAGLYLLRNVTGGSNVTIELFAKSTTSDGSINISFIAREFIGHPGEFNHTLLNNTNIASNTWTTIKTFTINNSNHASANLFARAGIPTISNSGSATVSYRFIMSDANGTKTIRTFDAANQEGISISQEIFQEVSTGIKTVTLQGKCSNSDCTIVGGDAVVFITSDIRFDQTSFNVSIFDAWDNTTINNFNVTLSTGTIFKTTTGTAIIVPNAATDNLVIRTTGYLNENIFNHNTSNNLNTSIAQSNITFNAFEIITFNQLFNVSYTIDGRTLIINDTGSFPLKSGNYNVTASKDNYFDKTQEITVVALDIKTFNITDMSSSVVNLTVQNRINGTFIKIFSGTISSPAIGYSVPFSTINGEALLSVVASNNFTIQLDTISGLSDFGNSINITTSEITTPTINKTIRLYTNNSISFRIFNFATGNLLAQNVTLELLGSTATFNFDTINGTLFVDQLNDDTYATTFSTAGFTDTKIFLTVNNNAHLNVNVFMQRGLTDVDFIVKNNNLVPIDGAILTFSTTINGTSIVVAQAETDFSGRATLFLNSSLRYSFTSVASGFDVFAGEVVPTQAEYRITMIQSATGLFTTMFDDVSYAVTFNFAAGGSTANSGLFINSILGSLEYFGLTATYNNITFTKNITTSPGGGFPNITITGMNISTNRTLLITYFFKSTGNKEFTFTESYFLPRVGGSNISIGGGLFNEITSLDENDPIRGIMAMFIIMLGVLILLGATRNMTIGVIGGLVATGLVFSLDLLPRNITIITIIVGVILIIGDNIK